MPAKSPTPKASRTRSASAQTPKSADAATKSVKAKRARPAAAEADAPYSWERAIKSVPLPATTRERILHAAVTLLHEDGFSSLTQQGVCERAGVRQSHLTYYFPTRNDLLRETAVFGCEALLHALVESDVPKSLQDIRTRLFVADESDRKFGRLMAALIVASDEDARIKPWLGSFEQENRAKIAELFRAVGAEVAEEDIEMLHAAYVGAVMLDIGESSPQSLARAQRVVHRAFDSVMQRSQPLPQRTPPRRSPRSNVKK